MLDTALVRLIFCKRYHGKCHRQILLRYIRYNCCPECKIRPKMPTSGRKSRFPTFCFLSFIDFVLIFSLSSTVGRENIFVFHSIFPLCYHRISYFNFFTSTRSRTTLDSKHNLLMLSNRKLALSLLLLYVYSQLTMQSLWKLIGEYTPVLAHFFCSRIVNISNRCRLRLSLQWLQCLVRQYFSLDNLINKFSFQKKFNIII